MELLEYYYDIVALVMFAALFGLLMLGFPVAFTLGGVALAFGLVYSGPEFLDVLPLRVYDVMEKNVLLAVPLFIFMGVTLERAGVAERLLETMALLFGRLRGGLALSVVAVGGLLAASTGIVGATTVTMGLLALPTMLKRGYSPELSTGVIAASGTLGQIIPPSIILVILADIIGVPVGHLFMAAVVPGLLLVVLYLLYVALISWLRPHHAPAANLEGAPQGWALIRQVARSLLPPALLVLVVLGSIFFGLAAPTEAAALGAFFALGLAAANRRLNREMVTSVCLTTTRLTSMVFIIMVAATLFGLVFRELEGDLLIREFFTGLEMNRWVVLSLVMGGLFLAGFFLDFIEITFIFVPVVAPILVAMGFDKTWLAILIAVNLQTSFLTPPFGYSLFYLKSVAPQVQTQAIYRGIIPFVLVQLLALGLVMVFPQLVEWLPQKMG